MVSKSKIYKKCSPNGKIFLYLDKREYVTCNGVTDPIKGAVFISDIVNTLQGRRIYVQLKTTFRYGREEDESMGITFKKEIILDRVQMFCEGNKTDDNLTRMQNVLSTKFGDAVAPFTLNFPKLAPNSIIICDDEDEDPTKRTMGVFYEVRVHVAEYQDDYKGRKGSSTSMGIRKTQFTETKQLICPKDTCSKLFICSAGSISLEASLEKEIFTHGEEIPVHVSIQNDSIRTIKEVKVFVYQFIDMKMLNMKYSNKVYSGTFEGEGCPILPGYSFHAVHQAKPLSQSTIIVRGVCLDAALSKEVDETNLASSSISCTGDKNDILGIVVDYVIKVKVVCGGLGGAIMVDIPIKLVHPKPDMMMALLRAKEIISAKRKKFAGQDSVIQESNEIDGSLDIEDNNQ
ncbi:arrestin homolog isoform X2 [Eurytemora carolleeae]|uniref:arrestin homolog isoform X2 n=1 Tax=Eurytemora carolleeae TaxID=1294199 RepID=UPI000C76D3EF|nr:arrestin homolog isoform X2 [Eurytemora carolleeae]|eukprot:XP_023336007.1 arrestin homolog isoform X2 [Eurytemora affinis]